MTLASPIRRLVWGAASFVALLLAVSGTAQAQTGIAAT